jgi:hypothetical protein
LKIANLRLALPLVYLSAQEQQLQLKLQHLAADQRLWCQGWEPLNANQYVEMD